MRIGWVERHPLSTLVLLVLVVRLGLAMIAPLTEDEIYYRQWAAHFQFGYYDHPPMIAWWIDLGVKLVGDNRLGIRLLPVLSTSVISAILAQLVSELGASRALALRAAIWFQAMFLVALGGMLATPDAPLTLFWSLTLLATVRASKRSETGPWLLVGVLMGLALLSKYSALFLAFGLLLWALSTPGRRAMLSRSGPWLAGLIALAFFAFNVDWNAHHHWVTFSKQFGRAVPHSLDVSKLLELLVGQFLLLNPIIVILAAWSVLARRRLVSSDNSPDLSLLVFTVLPFVAYLVLHAVHSRVQAHWPVPIYPAIAALAAICVGDARLTGWPARLSRSVVPAAAGIALLLGGATAFPGAVPGLDPARGLRGWPEFAARIDNLAQQESASWVGSISYGTAASLARAHPADTPVLQLYQRDRYTTADPSWTIDAAQPGLVVDLVRRVHISDLELCFAEIEQLPDLERVGPDGHSTLYTVVLVSGPLRPFVQAGCWDRILPSSEPAAD
ncbi:glycosyltransferase family 39 protein [uncultured Maricaulis sp.]|uniref:glycosyltransferase family 39 protein n=1 Tax=uncultured Maricaulis sp. TaxID=174710 RepID=UPI0030D9EFD4|tara:strand:- start:294452 stop:295957 length:1506 start_codon:yes stop_codon:yes gene_type:complete